MGKNESFAEFVIKTMGENGFAVSDFKGRPCHEVVTFKNSQGETRTVKFGFSSVERPTKNYRVLLNECETKMRNNAEIKRDMYCYKADLSHFFMKGGKNDSKSNSNRRNH